MFNGRKKDEAVMSRRGFGGGFSSFSGELMEEEDEDISNWCSRVLASFV